MSQGLFDAQVLSPVGTLVLCGVFFIMGWRLNGVRLGKKIQEAKNDMKILIAMNRSLLGEKSETNADCRCHDDGGGSCSK